jgi:putative ABC transport system permease protein
MAFFAGGCSLVALWAAVTLRYFHFHERSVFTATSFALLALWYALPGGRLSGLVGKLDAGAEMFFLSGAVMVTCGTFIVVYNADVILPAIATLGSRFGRITPAVKTAVAYPLTARFRTGLTIAMIGLIMFVLSMQAALNTNFSKAFFGDDARGGWDDRVLVNGNNRADELVAALKNSPPAQDQQPIDTSSITKVGELRVAEAFEVDVEDPEWLEADPATRKEKDHFKHVTLLGADEGFLRGQAIPLKFRAAGYESDQAAWDAVAKDANLAIIPALLTAGQQGFGPPGAEDVLELPERYTSKAFQPFKLRFRDRTSGVAVEITVVGQAKDSASAFWPGIFVQKDVVLRTFPDSKGQQFFVGLRPGVDSRAYAKAIEATLVQASADSLNKLIDDSQAQNRTFLEMFQGFLALGLIVGVAALGVISFRAVVERRQQIGMLRAIGYQRRMVQLSFLLESGFIAVSGILLGLALGLTFAWNLFDSGEFGETSSGISFTVPWVQVSLVTGFALVASMVMTYLPARAASHVAVAEALRYE